MIGLDSAGHAELTGDPVAARLMITGDFCPVRRIETMLLAGDVKSLFHDIAPVITSGDSCITNLEAALCRSGEPIHKLGPNLRADPDIAPALVSAGIDICCLANNHTMDYGPDGLAQTIEALDRAGLQHTGASVSGERTQPLRISLSGITISLLNTGIAEGAILPEGPGPWHLDSLDLLRAVQEEVSSGDRIVIPVIHAGREEVVFPSPGLRRLCYALTDAGAAAVICHHPHVPQGFEIMNGRPVAYSLGNFMFDWHVPEVHTDTSFVLELGLSSAGVSELTVHPFFKHGSGGIQAMDDNKREAFISFLNDISAPFDDPDMYRKLWIEQCRPQLAERYKKRLERSRNLDSADNEKKVKAELTFLNLMRELEHGEVLREGLIHEMMRGGRVDREARRILDTLRKRLCSFAERG